MKNEEDVQVENEEDTQVENEEDAQVEKVRRMCSLKVRRMCRSRSEEDAQVEEIGVLGYCTRDARMLFEILTMRFITNNIRNENWEPVCTAVELLSHQLTSSKTASEHLRCNIQVTFLRESVCDIIRKCILFFVHVTFNIQFHFPRMSTAVHLFLYI